jgi:hypothetical protein
MSRKRGMDFLIYQKLKNIFFTISFNTKWLAQSLRTGKNKFEGLLGLSSFFDLRGFRTRPRMNDHG